MKSVNASFEPRREHGSSRSTLRSRANPYQQGSRHFESQPTRTKDAKQPLNAHPPPSIRHLREAYASQIGPLRGCRTAPALVQSVGSAELQVCTSQSTRLLGRAAGFLPGGEAALQMRNPLVPHVLQRRRRQG